MRAIILNCTLKKSPETSNTEHLAAVMSECFEGHGCAAEMIRVVDENIDYGVSSQAQSETDGWPRIYEKILAADILVIASPTWLGHPSSLAQKVLERLDGMISETQDDGRPIAYDKVAGVVVTGNEDGAHHVISEISGALIDIGFTIPAQSWTYWNRGPGPGKQYLDTDEGHKWSEDTAKTAAKNLMSVARALKQQPVQKM